MLFHLNTDKWYPVDNVDAQMRFFMAKLGVLNRFIYTKNLSFPKI